MKTITAVKKYLTTNKEIFLQHGEDISTINLVNKENDFTLEYGERIANATVKKIDEQENPDAVTIYI